MIIVSVAFESSTHILVSAIYHMVDLLKERQSKNIYNETIDSFQGKSSNMSKFRWE